MRTSFKIVFTLLFVASIAVTCWKIYTLSQNQFVGLMVDRTEAALKVKIDKEVTKRLTSESVEKKLSALLDEEPREWLVIEAVKETTEGYDLVLSVETLDRYDQLHKQDHSFLIRTKRCWQCARDATQCTLSRILLCRVLIDLSPLGDLSTLTREASKHLRGEEIDKIDTTLSALGLGSIALGPKGTTFKVGASTAKTAKRMGLLSRGMTRMIDEAFDSIDWAAVARSRSITDLGKSTRTREVIILEGALSNFESIYKNQGFLRSMHLARHIDNADDARRLERVTRIQGKSTVGKIEILGKSRLLKMTMRYSSEAWTLLVGILGIFASLISLLWSVIYSMVTGFVRKKYKRSLISSQEKN